MGSIGNNNNSTYPALPEKTKWIKEGDSYILADKTKLTDDSRFTREGYTDYRIEAVYAVSVTSASGRTSSQKVYAVMFRHESLRGSGQSGFPIGFKTLQEAKDYILNEEFKQKKQ